MIVLVGLVVLALEFIHPGALLLIPGSILVVGGLLYLFLPDFLLDTPWGILVIIVAAIIATVIEIPYYRWIAPTHGPMTTTSAGLVGETGTVIAPVTVDTLQGKVRIKSEVWSARADRPIAIGARVRVVSGEGVAVQVVPVPDGERAVAG
ncbi:MAG TPA: NfeD family protein [Thermoplasmata archaeon]|nr:NfeD family protein [Thermoplasmata archaeon]